MVHPAWYFTWCTLYNLNKQGDNIQPWHTLFPILNQSIVSCLVLTVASWPAHRFLRRQVRWSDIPTSSRIFQFVSIHTVKGFGVFNEAEVDVLLELSCFSMIQLIWQSYFWPFINPAWTSGSSQFTYCWSLAWRIFEHYLASMWNECGRVVVWTFFGTAFLWDWSKNWSFRALWLLLSYPYLLSHWL